MPYCASHSGVGGEQSLPHTLNTWLTHIWSQSLSQQYGSTAHIASAHGLHIGSSAKPTSHSSWTHGGAPPAPIPPAPPGPEPDAAEEDVTLVLPAPPTPLDELLLFDALLLFDELLPFVALLLFDELPPLPAGPLLPVSLKRSPPEQA